MVCASALTNGVVVYTLVKLCRERPYKLASRGPMLVVTVCVFIERSLVFPLATAKGTSMVVAHMVKG